MTGQPTLSFDTPEVVVDGDTFSSPEQVSEAIEAGVREAERNADQEWRDKALQAIEIVARFGKWFTSDEVTALLEVAGVKTESPALGPVFQQAQRMGLIKNTHTTRRSKLTRRHRLLTVWSPS